MISRFRMVFLPPHKASNNIWIPLSVNKGFILNGDKRLKIQLTKKNKTSL